MKKLFIIPAVIGLLMTGNMASGAHNETGYKNLLPLSRAIHNLQSRDDYKKFKSVHFDRGEHSFVFAYNTVNGTNKQVTIDIDTGEEK